MCTPASGKSGGTRPAKPKTRPKPPPPIPPLPTDGPTPGQGGSVGDGQGTGPWPPPPRLWCVICRKKEKHVDVVDCTEVDKRKHALLAGPYLTRKEATEWVQNEKPDRKC